jgi:hypothetical protein
MTTIDLTPITELRPVIEHYLNIEGNICGGNLHITLEDGNTDDGSIKFCLDNCIARKDFLGAYIAEELLKMDQDNRDFY